ncbi:hypothetical protein AGMMS49593_08380 [Endomicrobiia bacterium]|nr:hypothetical protein AGMMS49593_08380 [Endomicrobiia bacterium]
MSGALGNYIVDSKIVTDPTNNITYTGILYKNRLLRISCYKDNIPYDQPSVTSVTFDFTSKLGTRFEFLSTAVYTIKHVADFVLNFSQRSSNVKNITSTSLTYFYNSSSDPARYAVNVLLTGIATI